MVENIHHPATLSIHFKIPIINLHFKIPFIELTFQKTITQSAYKVSPIFKMLA